MAGVKGRSGRRVREYEISIDKIVNQSNHVVYQFIRDENQPIEARANVAARFSIKYMPDKVEIKDVGLATESKVALMQALRGFIDSRSRNSFDSTVLPT